MRIALGLALWLIAGTASAQAVGYSTGSTGLNQSQVQALIPAPANTPPINESNVAVIGAQTMRYALEDHQHPRITRSAVTTTDGTGAWSVTWATALSSAPTVLPIAVNSGGQPVICNVTTRTTTTASGKCWVGQTTLLNLSIVTTGLTLNAFSNAAAGVSVQVFAIPGTQ